MRKYTNTFSQGINQDISTNKYPNTNFYWAQNFRLVSKDGLATGALTNVDGNNKVLSIGNSDEQVVGMCLIRDTLVMFVASSEGGKIFIWEHTNTDYETDSPKLIYTDPDLNFDAAYPVKAVGRYETEDVQKVYFTDGNSFFKHLNIVHPTLGLGGQLDYDVDSLDLVSDITFSNMSLELESGGNLRAGKIQYAYQLYSVRGSESVFSPTSQLVNLTEADDSQDSYFYYGSEVGTTINKSVRVTITNPDELFTRLRLVALEYTVLYQPPSIRIVGEYDIEDLTELSITDNGTSIGELTLEEFRFIQNNFYPQTLDIKDDYLFAANIKNEYFQITDDEFDARAFRASATDVISVYNGNNLSTIPFPFTTLPAFDTEIYNRFNDTSLDYGENNIGNGDLVEDLRCKYKPGSAGTILGGKGVNIEYEFITNQILLDDSNRTNDFGEGYPKLSTGASNTYDNTADPLLNAGYQRDEIYRFGIVFFDTKGRQSFVKWIGDIRFPNNREMPFVEYITDPNSELYLKTAANILGIRFQVNIPSEIESKISGYQIVRAERTNSDKTIIAQGLVSFPITADYTNSTIQGGPYDNYLYSPAVPTTVYDTYMGYTAYERATEDIINISGADAFVDNNTHMVLNKNWVEFDSPDVAFNKNKLPTSEAFLDVFGFQNTIETVAIAGERGFEDNDKGTSDSRDVLVADKLRNFDFETTGLRIKSDINNCRIFTPKPRGSNAGPQNDATNFILEGGQIYNNQAFAPVSQSGIKSKWGLRGTHALLTPETEFGIDSSWHDSTDPLRYLISNYKVYRGKSMYGGSTYEARTTSKYYPASEFVEKSTDTVFDSGVEGTGLIQLIRGNHRFVENAVIMVSNLLELDFYISNYGTEDLTVGTVTSSASSGWSLTVDPSGSVVPSGDRVNGKITYTGAATGISYTVITINSDAGNDTQFKFIVGVDYVNNPPDTTDTALDPYTVEDITSSLRGLRVFGGDTYISYFEYIRSLYDKERSDGYRIESYMFYPVESTINMKLRLDKIQDYINWGLYRDEGVTNYKLMETTALGINNYGVYYPTDLGNLYRYNSAYSSIDKSKEFYPEPFDFTNTLTNDTRILAAEKKINGEYIDQWTKFKFNNYIDVDSKHNAITKIVTFKNNLFYFQPTAVGIASVNERSVITDNQAKQLTVGTGGILTRYDYVTDKSGSAFYEGIIGTDDFLFYVDGRRKRVNKLVPGKEVALSVVKGIDSTLDKLAFDNVRVGFDRGYNEVIFAIDNTTIAFSESADAFVSSYSFNPGRMISIGGDFYSTYPFDDESPWLYADLQVEKVGYSGDTDADPDWDYILIGPGGVGEGLYKHNVGDPGSFYGGDGGPADSYLTLIINPMGNTVCFFDNLDLRTESTLNGTDQPDDIFYRMEASNNYQDITRELNFTSDVNQSIGTIKRLGRVWRTPIIATPPSGSSYSRMLDTYLKVTLRYNNDGTNTFRVHDVVTYFRPSNH